MRITRLHDVVESCLPARAVLAGHQAKPGGELTSAPEVMPIANHGQQRGGGSWADPAQAHELLSPGVIARDLRDVLVIEREALGVHNWPLDSIALSKQQAHAAHLRRPSMTARIEKRRQAVEVVCFLHATLMELTDIALLQASRRSQE